MFGSMTIPLNKYKTWNQILTKTKIAVNYSENIIFYLEVISPFNIWQNQTQFKANNML